MTMRTIYIHGGREESNIYVYVFEGHEDEGLIIRVYYPYKEKRTGNKGYDEAWYIYEKTSNEIKFEEINNGAINS